MIQERNSLHDAKPIGIPGRLSVLLAPEAARFSLRLRQAGIDAAGAAFGCPLPADIGGVSSSGGLTAMCIGPDEWTLLAPLSEAETIEAGFAAAAIGPHSLVDVSHRELGIELRGSAATSTLSAFCALDLATMPDGSATRTILDKAQGLLVKHSAEHYRIEVWQSFAGHLWTLLAAVGREVALDL
ncbi:sarcosine oxidase subunit gamma [Aureimonas endophytica]|uniref:Sarcosine oxidase subunit gamma n=1 Tax=Aureimonas endophytica TaxID=2027858 RepID=A0A917E8X5_9HYPH|nr:sarcosine oxidase subunit gamma family protein [Aureimonas endophytica]GGE15644.1 sarcosine oxidase subunit gamma [Aureimonas endophytica]